jgi:hypothetical protein
MDLEILVLNEINQTHKDKYCMFSLTCRIFRKKTDMNIGREHIKEEEGDQGEGGKIREGIKGIYNQRFYLHG